MKMRILLVQTTNSGTAFWRLNNFHVGIYRNGLAEVKHLWWQKDLMDMHPWERDIQMREYVWRITKELQEYALKADVIVMQMLHGNGQIGEKETVEDYVDRSIAPLRAIKDLVPSVPVLMEIDDNMLSTPNYNAADIFYGPGQALRKLAVQQMKESDGIVCSTPYLAELYSEFNQNTFVATNCIDFAVWDRLKHKDRGGLRIGWAGGATHEGDFEPFKDSLLKVLEKHRDAKLVLVHGAPSFLRGHPQVEWEQKWTRIDKYPQKLANLDFDIGIAPLVDNAFNRGKSNLRWLECSALGVPIVAAKVGHFAETIQHEVDGLLADSPEDFERMLNCLIEDKAYRKQVGGMANNRVRKDFNLDLVSRHYVRNLEKIVSEYKKPVEVLS